MECIWCGGEYEPFRYGGGLGYCSHDCERASRRYSLRCFEARLDGEDPPTKEEFMTMQQRSRRWTPDAMRERVAELRLEVA